MEGIESWGISVIQWLQSSSGPATDSIFKLITFLGDERFLLLLLPLVYWCIDKGLGIRLAVLVLASSTINPWCKYALELPRPPEGLVQRMGPEMEPGFPSGHTQRVMVAFSYLAREAQRRAAYVGAAALILLVGLSRMYMGMHFPHDVLGGLVLGLLAVLAFLWLVPLVEVPWASWPRALRYGLAVGLPVALLVAWPLEDTAASLGALAGFAVGALLEVEQVRFVAAGAPLKRILRFLLGFVFVAGLYFGLRMLLPEGIPWRFLRYGSVGLFASVVAPWLFVRLRLAEAEAPAAAQPALAR